MKLWSVSMVRNEADIVEAFVRHNLQRVDGMVIVDHGSIDDTLDILAKLSAEGLRIVVLRSALLGYLQTEITTAATRQTFERTGADFVFPLDADEFLKWRSRAVVEEVLGRIPPGIHGLLRWLTYVPDFSRPAADIVEAARHAKRVKAEQHGRQKAIVARHFMQLPRGMIAMGNHSVVRDANRQDEEVPHILVSADAAAIAHLPIRSAEQFVAKVALKRLARMAVDRDWTSGNRLVPLYQAIREGRELTQDVLLDAAIHYSVPLTREVEPGTRELVTDPFLADFPLRYTRRDAADPLRQVLALADQMARTASSAAG